jgi:hypothetical protein
MMKDPTNEVECSGVKIKGDCLPLVQKKMADFPSIRFLYNPMKSMKWEKFDYYEISFGGKVLEVNDFKVALKDLYFEYPKEEKISFFQRIFGKHK